MTSRGRSAAGEPYEDQLNRSDDVSVAREFRLFHGRLAEALESAVDALRNDIATEIVGRELQLAPADLKMIVRRALARYKCSEPLRIRVHPDDASQNPVECVVTDASLRPGDAVIELHDGEIDATLGVRLEALLESYR